VARRQNDGARERYRDLDRFAAEWPFVTSSALMPFTTVLSTAKFVLRTVAEIASVPADLARVAISISTSDGEFAREGTRCEGGFTESNGKTW
jgi:hypothetical protein